MANIWYLIPCIKKKTIAWHNDVFSIFFKCIFPFVLIYLTNSIWFGRNEYQYWVFTTNTINTKITYSVHTVYKWKVIVISGIFTLQYIHHIRGWSSCKSSYKSKLYTFLLQEKWRGSDISRMLETTEIGIQKFVQGTQFLLGFSNLESE